MSEFLTLLNKNQVLKKSEKIETYLTDVKYSRRIFRSKIITEEKECNLVIFIYEDARSVSAIHFLRKENTASILTTYENEDTFLRNGWDEINEDLKSASANASVDSQNTHN
jgi:hypothetical protein